MTNPIDPVEALFHRAPSFALTAHDATAHHICNEGDRPDSDVWYTVFHSTEGVNNAWGVAVCMSGGGCSGSVQAIASSDVGVRLLPDTVIPCGAPPFNFHGVHIEQCGFSAWTRLTWFLPGNRRTIQRTAQWIARRLTEHGLPNNFGTVPQLKRMGVEHFRGFTSHRNVSLAFGESSHTDPGAPDRKHYPYWYLRRQVTKALAA